MGKIILAGVLVLALAPATLVGLPTKAQKLAIEARKMESKYEGQLDSVYEDYGTNCAFSLSGEDQNDMIQKIQTINRRRRDDRRRHGMPALSDYNVCGGEGYGS